MLFTRHGAAVLGLCRVLLRQREEAEDAVQQTFLSAYRSLLNGVEPRNPAGWLATIARNECWGRIQQRMREPLAVPDPESTLPDPVAAAAERADLAALWQAIGELPRQQRQALLLREFSGLSYAELATALGVSTPAVESLLFRARRRLRVRLHPIYGSAAIAPLGTIRDALSQTIDGFNGSSPAGPLAKIGSAPLLAKLLAGGAAVVVAGGTVTAVAHRDRLHHPIVKGAHAATWPLDVASAAPPPSEHSVAHAGSRSPERARPVFTRVVRRISGEAATTKSDNSGDSRTSTTESSDNSSSDSTTTTTSNDSSGDSADSPSADSTDAGDSGGD